MDTLSRYRQELEQIAGLDAAAREALAKAGVGLARLGAAQTDAVKALLTRAGLALPPDATIDQWRSDARDLVKQALIPVRGIGDAIAQRLANAGIDLVRLAILPKAEIEKVVGKAENISGWKLQARTLTYEQLAAQQEHLQVRDMARLNEEAYARLQDRADQLKRKRQDQDGQLEADLVVELEAAAAILAEKDRKVVIDPLFKAVQAYQAQMQQRVPDHFNGVISYAKGDSAAAEAARMLVAMYGIMVRENLTDPSPLQRVPDARAIVCDLRANQESAADPIGVSLILQRLDAPRPDGTRFPWDDVCAKIKRAPASQRFDNALALAQAEYNRSRQLFDQTLRRITNETRLEIFGKIPSVASGEWSRVAGTLAKENVAFDDPHLGLKVDEALSGHVGGKGDGMFLSGIEIDLPDLEEQAAVEIVFDNLLGMQAIYYAAMLDEMKFFQVRDKVIDNFRLGLTPFGRGRAGGMIYQMLRATPNRLSEYDRRNLYSRTLGLPGGDTTGSTNRDFQTLWLRFVSAVSSFARQLSLDYLLRANIPVRIHQEAVKKAGRDLAANLSLFGYGITFFAAGELQQQINETITLLSDSEVKASYGARDIWGVVDQVATLELGGARDTVRWRTMAGSGAIIIRWLAKKASALAAVGSGDVLDVNEIYRPRVRPSGSKATTDPYDSDLVNACERWLAVTGTPDTQVESYAQPVESPVMTSQPIPIPSIAREMLQSVGVNGYGPA